MDISNFLGRNDSIFSSDLIVHGNEIDTIIQNSRILVIGGAGSIGQAVVKAIFCRNPKLLHVVDISENNLVELVRSLRSNIGYKSGEFATYAIDAGSIEFQALIKNKSTYDFILNLAALKHVRSEADPYTLMRMIKVNILDPISIMNQACFERENKYFCVSTDKAANPINMMGATKRLMERSLEATSYNNCISFARFANVAFSDGSLLHGFLRRIQNKEPFSAPKNISRYFMTPGEAAELCLFSCFLGEKLDIFIPKQEEVLEPTLFTEIAEKFLDTAGYEPYMCESEEEARENSDELIKLGKWPCYFFESDTTGEKMLEEFYTASETVDRKTFETMGVIKGTENKNTFCLDEFTAEIMNLRNGNNWDREKLLRITKKYLPEFSHFETGKYLNDRM